VPFGRAPLILSFVPIAAADAALRVLAGREPGETERRETT
jgi:hypothetical protein